MIPAFVAIPYLAWTCLILYLYNRSVPIRFDEINRMVGQFSQADPLNSYMLLALKSILIAGWLGWLAFRTGKALLKLWVPPSSLSRLEVIVFGCGLGFGCLSQLVLALGLAGLWYAGVYWGILISLTALFLIFRTPLTVSKTTAEERQKEVWTPIWLFVLGLIYLAFLVADLTPEIFYDALVYHLGIPNLFRMAHRIYNLSDSLFSNFVLTIEMLYGLSITIGNEIVAKLLHGEMAMLLGLALFAFGQRFLTKTGGLLAAILFLSMPLVGLNVGTTGIDVAWSFFQFLGAYALTRSGEAPRGSWLRLAGVFTGLAASCKYSGIAFVPIGCLIILWGFREEPHRAFRSMATDLCNFALPALAILLPVLMKNIYFHHNPIYPFAGTFWGKPILSPERWKILVGENAPILWGGHPDTQSALRFVFHPWFITFEGMNRSNFIGPLYLMALPLFVISPAAGPATRLLKRYGLLLWAFWLCTSQVPRFALPALAVLAPVLAEGFLRIAPSGPRRHALMILLVVGVAMNFENLVKAYFMMEGWKVPAGLESPKAYLQMAHHDYPAPPFQAIDWMNGHLPPSAKVLYVGESRCFYSSLPVVANSVCDPQFLVEACKRSQNRGDLADALRKEHISHIFLNFIGAQRGEHYHLMAWDDRSWSVFSDFWSRYVNEVWKAENKQVSDPKYLVVYRVLDEKEALEPHIAPENPFLRWAPRAPA